MIDSNVETVVYLMPSPQNASFTPTMNTIVCTFGIFLLLVAPAAWSQNTPVPAIPDREGRLTKVDEGVYVDLSKVKVIKGGITISYRTGVSKPPLPPDGTKQAVELFHKQMREANRGNGTAILPLTKEGIQQAMEIVKRQISLLTPGKLDDQIQLSAVINLDDTTIIKTAGALGDPITDAAVAEQILNASHQHLTKILKLAE